MPLAFLALAWLAIMTGIRGDYTQVGQAFSQDVIGANGSGGFVSFGAGLIGIALFFRVIGAPNAGKVFIGLVLLVFIIQNPNILTALQNVGGSSQTAVAPPGANASAQIANAVTGGPVASTASGTQGGAVTSPGTGTGL